MRQYPSNVAAIFGLIGACLLSACGGSNEPATGVTPPSVASVAVAPDSLMLVPGRLAQLSVTLRSASGTVLNGHNVVWSSAENSKVTVTQTGQVSAVALGRAVVTATSEGKSGSTIVVVLPTLARDFSIVAAQFTQGVQDAASSIPMVLSGDAAVVNVLIQGAPPSTTPTELVLRLLDAGGSVVYTDTAVARNALGTSSSYLAPSAQFLVPSTRLAAGVRWQIVRDPRGVVADDVLSNDVFPRDTPQSLATVSVPPLNIRFVPIVLASNNNTTPTLSDAVLPDYLRTARSIHPLGAVNAHVGATFTTSSSFGTAPSGGDQTFWTQLLSELDLARIADPTESSINWYGVVAPPPGFTFTAYGGFSYIPSSGTASGPRTRTSVGVRTGWFTQTTQARDLVAHELAHTFGRQHAPCGAAGAPLDAAYPVAGGVLDVAGHDVYSWANGLASSAATVSANTGDVMGYCFPVWASTYTYKAVLQFRQGGGVIAARENVAESARTRVIVVRGNIENEQTIKLEPAFSLMAHPTVPGASDSYRVEGLAEDGHVLFASTFEPAVLDHAPNLRQFTVAVPLAEGDEDLLAEVRVQGPAGQARAVRAASSVTRIGTAVRIAAERRPSDGSLGISCPAQTTRGILVLDSQSGAVLGSASAASMRAIAPAGTRLTVLCSDAVRTLRGSTVAPD